MTSNTLRSIQKGTLIDQLKNKTGFRPSYFFNLARRKKRFIERPFHGIRG